MPRNLSEIFKTAIFAQQTSASVWALCELNHPTLTVPLRLVTNNVVITRLGVEWSPAMFDVIFPEESADQLAKTTLIVENIDRTILDALRALESPLSVKLYIVTSVDEDLVIGPFEFTWRETTYDSTKMQGSLEAEDLLNRRYPKDEIVPSKFEALYR